MIHTVGRTHHVDIWRRRQKNRASCTMSIPFWENQIAQIITLSGSSRLFKPLKLYSLQSIDHHCSVRFTCTKPCYYEGVFLYPWWRHQMETISALLTICAGNSPVTGVFHAQRLVTRSFDVFCDLRLNKRLSKKWWSWWFETPSHPLWRHCNDYEGTFLYRGLLCIPGKFDDNKELGCDFVVAATVG